MAIDDPIEAVERQYPENKAQSILEHISDAASIAAVVLPHASPFLSATGAIAKVVQRLTGPTRSDRISALVDALKEAVRFLQNEQGQLKVKLSDLESAMQLAVFYDVNEFNDLKRYRYVKIILGAVRSDTQVDDLSSFIQDVERLGERDIIGLKVLNTVMNKHGDWSSTTPNPMSQPTLHPNTLIQRAQELAVQMAQALSGDSTITDGNRFSREDGLQICLRLQGFGLAQEIQTESRQVPITNYCARLTPRGLMLLRLLGEVVPNWERYFDENGPL